jgi:ribosomal protein S18 acetylase RimI-like enzyme
VDIEMREMLPTDHTEVLALWRQSEGVGLSGADQADQIELFLQRNAGLCFVVCEGRSIIGAVLCGNDGRRGYLYHLAVSPSHRHRGVGRSLVEHCLAGLRRAGIDKCHIFVFAENQEGLAFWRNIGWTDRLELRVMSHAVS